MFGKDTIDDALLKRYMMELSAGDYLFQQGEKGNTLYVILKGQIQLSHKVHSAERVVATLGEGEVVGERAVLGEGPYRRGFSAIATTDTQLLEFGADDLRILQGKFPDFPLRMLALVIRRLDRANHLVSVLQVPEPIDRMIHYLQYLFQHAGSKEATGIKIAINNDELALAANVDRKAIDNVLDILVRQGIMKKTADGYLIADENALFEFLPTLRERAAA